MRLMLIALVFGVAFAESALARMSASDFREASKATQALAQFAAEYELCQVDTDDVDDVLNRILSKCDASNAQEADLRALFASTKIRHRQGLRDKGIFCRWSRADAQANYKTGLGALRPMIRQACE